MAFHTLPAFYQWLCPAVSACLCLGTSSWVTECHSAFLRSMPEGGGLMRVAYENASSLTPQMRSLRGVCFTLCPGFPLGIKLQLPGDSWLNDVPMSATFPSLYHAPLPTGVYILSYLHLNLYLKICHWGKPNKMLTFRDFTVGEMRHTHVKCTGKQGQHRAGLVRFRGSDWWHLGFSKAILVIFSKRQHWNGLFFV